MRFLPGAHDAVRRVKALTFAEHPCEFKPVRPMNESLLSTSGDRHSPNETLNMKKVVTTTCTTNNTDHQRTVLARHVFQANVKQTRTRWIRETPV